MRRETGNRKWETGYILQETGDGRGFFEVISEKFSAFYLPDEIIHF